MSGSSNTPEPSSKTSNTSVIHSAPPHVAPAVISKPNERSLTLFLKLKEKDNVLTARNYQWWFSELDDALLYGDVWFSLFAKDGGGNRPNVPDPSDPNLVLYHAANKAAAAWIKTAAGYTHRAIVQKFSEKGDGVGMYDALRNQFGKMAPTSRYFDVQSLFRLRDSSLPVVGTNWSERCSAIANLKNSLRDNCAGMSIEDFIDEMAFHTLIFSLPDGDEFQQRLIANLDSGKTTFEDAREQLIKHALVKTTRAEANGSPPDAAHAVTESPSIAKGSQALRTAPHSITYEELAAAVQANIRCFQCGGPHFKRDCPQLRHGNGPQSIRFQVRGGQQTGRFITGRFNNGNGFQGGQRGHASGQAPARWRDNANAAQVDNSTTIELALDDQSSQSSFPIDAIIDGITIDFAGNGPPPTCPASASGF